MPIIVPLVPLFLGLCIAAMGTADAAVPQVELSQARPAINLAETMVVRTVPATQMPDPEAFWGAPSPSPSAPPAPQLQTRRGERLVGRVTLQGSREKEEVVVLVPSARVDEVQLWYRHQDGDSWKGAIAGDRVALSRWPFVGPFPAFPILLGERPVDLIVTVLNDGGLTTPVLVLPDAEYRHVQTRQSELSGLVNGLGLMVVVVCVISGIALQRANSWLLAVVAAWGLFSIMCVNGDTAIWLTPEWPDFNDASKHLTSAIMSGLMVAMVVQALDARSVPVGRTAVTIAAPLTGLVYAGVQAAWLPNAWRAVGGVAWGLIAISACLLLCATSALAGGRYVRLVAAAALCYAGAVVSSVAGISMVGALDVRPAVSAAFLFAGVLLIRHALFSRERYGRDVLGRAAVSAHRDPLTALLSYSGFELAFDEALLRQHSRRGEPWVMLLALPGLERASADHGFVLTERALVRFAACLQSTLGDGWAIGRLSKDRFACVSGDALNAQYVQALATQVLASCTRLSEPLGIVGDFNLRLACTRCRGVAGMGLTNVLQELENAAHALDGVKRITLV